MVVREQLLEHHRARHGVSYAAVRPASFVPWTNWARDYSRGLLYERVDREDVLEAIRWWEIGYRPSRHFGAWVGETAALTDGAVRSRKSDY
jgi:hypothetical protein